jgi:transcription initiation factor IIE alpha subunit
MSRKPELNGRAVLRAVYELKDREQLATPTAIADYLRGDVANVRRCLRELREARILDVRTRRGQKVWLPWREAN